MQPGTAVALQGQSTPAAARLCHNVYSQSGKHKRLCIGRSGIHGWGAFALEPIEKNDFIYEYTGELISQVRRRWWEWEGGGSLGAFWSDGTGPLLRARTVGQVVDFLNCILVKASREAHRVK